MTQPGFPLKVAISNADNAPLKDTPISRGTTRVIFFLLPPLILTTCLRGYSYFIGEVVK